MRPLEDTERNHKIRADYVLGETRDFWPESQIWQDEIPAANIVHEQKQRTLRDLMPVSFPQWATEIPLVYTPLTGAAHIWTHTRLSRVTSDSLHGTGQNYKYKFYSF